MTISRTIHCQCCVFLLAFVGGAVRADDAPLNVMTYNLRFASTQMPHAWSVRRPVMREDEVLRDALRALAAEREGLTLQMDGVLPEPIDQSENRVQQKSLVGLFADDPEIMDRGVFEGFCLFPTSTPLPASACPSRDTPR